MDCLGYIVVNTVRTGDIKDDDDDDNNNNNTYSVRRDSRDTFTSIVPHHSAQ